jgi:DNA repair protein RecN (Recombination protein N)
MLSRITIKDLVIVRRMDLALHAGMTTLTGETGAGKSILIDALGLALGDKADNGMIRRGADKAEISVSFEIGTGGHVATWLEAHDLAADGECLLRRVLIRDGRSRAYVNGTPVPVAHLRELGEQLIDIHGQHAHQSLLQPRAQRALLDGFANLHEQLRATADCHRIWQEQRRRHEELSQAATDRVNRLDYLRYQIDELEPLACTAETLHELGQEQARLANAEQLLNDTAAILAQIDSEDASVQQVLHRSLHTMETLTALDPALTEVRDLLESAGIQLEEAANGLRHYQDRIEIDPARLQDVDAQLGKLHDAARKHRVAPEALGTLLQGLREEAATLEHADVELAQLGRRLDDSRAAYDKAAQGLSKARRAAAKRLTEVITESMQALGMQGGEFAIECEPLVDKPTAEGIDRVRFLVAANPGQTLAPLSEVASGGELSRISLAIQVATADCGQVPTLIFDEVDVGIGGAVAEIVGQLLRRLGGERQVLCVTHLAQVASQAHQQCRIVKMTDGKSTETRIDPLDDRARVDEIARMLGGVDITEHTRRHADEMIRRAQKAS